jgi:hypothetical protein
MNKKGQLTIFIILAILIVAVVAGFLIFRGNFGFSTMDRDFQPIYNNFLGCIEEEIDNGILILETHGGYIESPEFQPGSLAFPFSSELDFVGVDIPYWYYVSGGGVQKTQIPSVSDMESQLEEFVLQRIEFCNFESFYERGYTLKLGEDPKADVKIKDNEVTLDLDMSFLSSYGSESVFVDDHSVSVNSKLGSLYKDALKVYGYEQENLFLENYGLDILNLYAPVDGVEFTCSPKIWVADNIFNDIEEAIELNTMNLKVGSENEYSYVDINTENNIRFLNSRNWPRSFEVNPSEDNLLRADPVGNQPGMGILGFCYVSYHFVYNVNYPVLVQVSSEENREVFQFPMAVVIQGNRAREPLTGDAFALQENIGLCDDLNSLTKIFVYDKTGREIDANISYNCLDQKCNLGKSSGGEFNGYLPQCVNGFIIANSEGYEEESFMYSSVNRGQVSVYLDKLYELELNLFLEGSNYKKEAIVNFVSDDKVKSVYYPEQRSVELSEGEYEVQVYVYSETPLEFPETNFEQCYDVPRGPVLGYFGATKKECVQVEYPEQMITSALVAGGASEHQITGSQLRSSRAIELNVDKLPNPNSIQQVQENYILFEDKDVEVKFK